MWYRNQLEILNCKNENNLGTNSSTSEVNRSVTTDAWKSSVSLLAELSQVVSPLLYFRSSERQDKVKCLVPLAIRLWFYSKNVMLSVKQ